MEQLEPAVHPLVVPPPDVAPYDDLTPPRHVMRRILQPLRHRSLLVGLVICVVILILIIVAPLLISTDPNSSS